MSQGFRDAARAIFASALQAVDVRAAVRSRIIRQGNTLTLAGRRVLLSNVDKVLIVAMGKAAFPMYAAAAEAMHGVAQQAVVVAPRETLLPRGTGMPSGWSEAVFLPGAHPTPTADSLYAARRILEMLGATTPRTVVLFLISGGASAMVEQPLDTAITLDDLAVFSRALVGSGLSITAMNTLRKHLSAVKGGRLAAAAAAAQMQCTLLISDVPEASPDAVASGPSLPDSTDAAAARRLFASLQRASPQPARIAAWFDCDRLPETPKADDAAFARSQWEVILSSDHLARAALIAAEAQGFQAVVDNSCDDWDYREAGRYLLDCTAALATSNRQRTCLISVGEVGVTLSSHPGEGGRNQQFALWCAHALEQEETAMTVLSAGSDGIDGHSTAAGAVCDETTAVRAAAAGFSVHEALRDLNAAPLLRAIGDDLQTGPTGNNLRDLRLLLTD